jgi:hypothetical protein
MVFIPSARYFFLVLLCSIPSFAAMIYAGAVDMTGTGLGHVPTILTMQQKGNESGCVSFDGSGDVLGALACVGGNDGGDEKTGASQTLTRSFSDIGVSAASDLVVIFNPSQPAGGEINLANLTLSIFSPSGTLLFSSGAFTAMEFDQTDKGTGKSGFAFRLDDQDAVLAAPFVSAGNRMGLSATATASHGGLETFFVSNIQNFPELSFAASEIPEPATFMLLGFGLIALAWIRKRFA